MNQTQQSKNQMPDSVTTFFQAVRDDLLMLALLHDRELDRGILMNLRKDCYEELFGLRLQGAQAHEALRLFRQGIDDIPTNLDQKTLDILAAEYADIYLNYSIDVSPCESVWVDEDGLTMQDAMFQIRKWYARHGLTVGDWRIRSDDHLVTQLQFLAYLLEGESTRARLEEVSRFLDEHLLRWIGAFAERVSTRCQTRIYGGLVTLTAAYLEEFRDLAAGLLDTSRPSAEDIEKRMGPQKAVQSVAVAAPAPFVPGAAPSW